MYLTQLALTNFRNYTRLLLDLPRHTIVLQGANAQGKTNLLEAIYYLAAARSPYTVNDTQLVNWLAAQDDLPHARVAAELARGDSLIKIEIVLVRNGDGYQKHIRVNGVSRRAMDLLGLVNVVLFVPQDIALVDGAPAHRRHYLDVMLCQIDPAYRHALAQYNRVLERRNALLKSLRDRNGARKNGVSSNGETSDQLEFWDERLIEHGSLIVSRRQQAVIDLESLAQPVHHDLSGGHERLRLRYMPSFDPHPQRVDARQMSLTLDLLPPVSLPQKPEEIRPAFAQALHSTRSEELVRGMTLVGPHRDEFRFFDGQIDLHVYGSRGQQRTTVLALKLAEVALMARTTGEQPILLLDDVLSELDIDRRRYLCARLDRVEQALITTTDLGDLTEELRETATVYTVSHGRMEQKG